MRKGMDYSILVTIFMLLAIGIVLVFSASYYYALSRFGDMYYFIKPEIMFVAIGVVLLLVISNIPYKLYKVPLLNYGFALISFVLLVMTRFMGVERNGAKRWLDLGVQFQPSEIAKLAIILLFARLLSREKTKIKNIKHFLVYMAILAAFAIPIYIQPDYSSTIMLLVIGMMVIYTGARQIGYLFLSFTALVPTLIFLLTRESYRMKRLTDYWRSIQDISFANDQVKHSIFALGSGGFFGVGVGKSIFNKLYLPEPQNDFILATLGEEFGLLGTGFVLFLFLFLIYRGYKVAATTQDAFGSLLVMGIISMVAVQVIVNFTTATGFLPPTGVSLPLISYGGTNLLIMISSLGIVLSVSKYGTGNKEE